MAPTRRQPVRGALGTSVRLAVFVCAAALVGVATGGDDAKQSPAALPDGDGGLAGLSPKEVESLRKARDVLIPLAMTPSDDEGATLDYLESLLRIHEGLDDWGLPGQAETYVKLAFSTRSPRIQAAAIVGAQSAAKARGYHLGGVHQLWRDIDATQPRSAIAGDAQQVRAEFLRCVESFSADKKLAPDVPLFELKPVRINLDGLQTFPAPKAK